jgi:hypothetical protein
MFSICFPPVHNLWRPGGPCPSSSSFQEEIARFAALERASLLNQAVHVVMFLPSGSLSSVKKDALIKERSYEVYK